MHAHVTCSVGQIDICAHPAVAAWTNLQGDGARPDSVAILNKKEKSVVYRIETAGPPRASVIAKRCSAFNAAIERSIYEEVLPHLSVSMLKFYGCIEEPDTSYCWLFLEDAGGLEYSPSNEEHRLLVVQWLAAMHTSAAHVAAVARLPDRGPGNYLRHLRSGRANIERQLGVLGLDTEDTGMLKSIVSHCNLVESHWSEVEAFCDAMPRTLVHGDFAPKNVHVRMERGGMSLLPLDWETAGYGVPATDLTRVDASVYRSLANQYWPHLSLEDINYMTKLGHVFRWLATVDWLSGNVTHGTSRWFTAVMRDCDMQMAAAIGAVGWKD
jgi:hypothetical protein